MNLQEALTIILCTELVTDSCCIEEYFQSKVVIRAFCFSGSKKKKKII